MKANNRSFTIDEFEDRVRTEKQLRYAACFTLLFLTGMRVSECLPLTRANIEITPDGFVVIEAITLKRGGHPIKNVVINLQNKKNRKLVETYVFPYLKLFEENRDVRMFPMHRLLVHRHAKLVGFQTVHNLRRSFINNMAAAGATEFDVVSMLNLHDSKVIHKSYASKFQTSTLKRRLRELGV